MSLTDCGSAAASSHSRESASSSTESCSHAGGDLLVAAAAGAYAFGDGGEMLGVRAARLVLLGGVGLAGDRLDLGEGQIWHGPTVRPGGPAPGLLIAIPPDRRPGRCDGGVQRLGDRAKGHASRQSSSSARSSLTSFATASIRCQAAPSKPAAT